MMEAGPGAEALLTGAVGPGQVKGLHVPFSPQFVHATSSAVQGPQLGHAPTSLHRYGSYALHILELTG
jgi:hypothetical protein